MKHLLLLTLTIPVLLVACTLKPASSNESDAKLTDDRVKAALTKWNSDCAASVAGIQEMPQQNMARASLYFSHCEFAFHFKNAQPGTRDYSGSAEAVFTHYNDGRWVLTQVSAREGWPPFEWNNLNIEAR